MEIFAMIVDRAGMASDDDDIVFDIENFDFENAVVPVSPLCGDNIAFARREATSHEP